MKNLFQYMYIFISVLVGVLVGVLFLPSHAQEVKSLHSAKLSSVQVAELQINRMLIREHKVLCRVTLIFPNGLKIHEELVLTSHALPDSFEVRYFDADDDTWGEPATYIRSTGASIRSGQDSTSFRRR